MSDERLRELSRRWRESGSPEDEAAWLAESLRAGVLSRRLLEVAARLGAEAPARVLGIEPADWSGWGRERWPFEVGVFAEWLYETAPVDAYPRAVVAAQRHRLRRVHDDNPTAWALLACAEAWILEPTEERLEAYRRRSEGHGQINYCGWALSLAGLAHELPSTEWLLGYDEEYRQGLVRDSLGIATFDGAAQAETATLGRQVIAAVREEVVPWALGRSDPVRERVEARRGTE